MPQGWLMNSGRSRSLRWPLRETRRGSRRRAVRRQPQQTASSQLTGAPTPTRMLWRSHDLDEMVAEAGMSEDKPQRAMVDAARLADELRQEQELAMALERDKKLLEAQVKDAQNRVDEAEQNALKGGKKAMAKMETRIRELESEMDAENRRCTDAQKNLRK